MFSRLFGRDKRANQAIVDSLYASIVAAARQPALYEVSDAPDTPLGRFEMLSLHIFLFLHRVRGLQGAPAEISQEVVDAFFLDVDHSLRELGIGDVSVPKRMKKLAAMFYGRAKSYGDAVDANDIEALTLALGRNVVPAATGFEGANALAAYVMEASRMLKEQSAETIASGTILFPEAKEGASYAS